MSLRSVLKRTLPLMFFAILLAFFSKGQMQHRSLEIGGLAGQMLNIYPDFPARKAQTALLISYSHWRRSQANEDFHRPESGVCLSFHNFGNSNDLGYGVGLQYQITFHQKLSERLSLTECFRPGLIYNTKPYHYLSNTKNIVSGAPFSALIGASMGLNYKMTSSLSLNLEATLWHASNGHTGLPNVGMNSPMGMLSVQYRFDKSKIDTLKFTRGSFDKKMGIVVMGSIGVNQAGGTTRPTNGQEYVKGLVSIGGSWRTRTTQRWTLTLDACYDQTYRLWNETQEWTSKNAFTESSAIILMLGHEWIYQHWSLISNGGLNLYNPTLGKIVGRVEEPNIANVIKRYVPGRFAVRYYFTHPWKSSRSGFVQLGIKSNFGQADFVEMGLGWVISGR
jgi:hypothetical protein